MKAIFYILLIFPFLGQSQETYKTVSGIVYHIGDSLKIGQPLSHLGWRSIYVSRNDLDYFANKNLVTKVVIISEIDTINKPVNFGFKYLGKNFRVDIDEAIRNKEVIPQLEQELAGKGPSKYDQLIKLKELLDQGILTPDEFEKEKKKILGDNQKM